MEELAKRRAKGEGSLVERGGRWYMSFKFQGKRRQRATNETNKRKAERALSWTLEEIKNGTFKLKAREKKGERLTIADEVERYITIYLKTSIPRSWQYEETMLMKFVWFIVEAKGEQVRVRDIEKDDCLSFINALSERGLAGSRINRYKTALRNLFDYFLDKEELLIDPMRGIENVKEKPMTRPFEDYEKKRFLGVSMPDWFRAFCEFDFRTGLRESDVLNLRWEDIDLESGFVYIRQIKNETPLKFELNTGLRSILESMPRNGTLLVFGDGTKTFRFKVIREFKKACKVAGLPYGRGKGLTIHSIRHTYGTELYAESKDIVLVQKAMGHESLRSTERYVHINAERLKKASQMIDKIMGGVSQPSENRLKIG